MTPQTILTPFRHGAGERTGARTFRKQLLPIDKPIAYKGRTLSFTRPYLEQIAANFNAGAYDQVPAVLANEDNQHNEDPERYRGEVKAVEVTDTGLDVVVEMTEKGADLIAENPRLGVSARLVPNLERGDQSFENVLRHVCLTLDPRANGLRAWEVVSEDSVLSRSQSSEEALDFSNATYPDEMPDTPTLTDEQLTELQALKPEDRGAKLRELVPAEPAATPEATDEGKGILARLKKMLDGHDAELEKSFDDLKNDAADADKDADKDKQPVASLSDDDRKAIDLAQEEARTARRETAEANWKLERKEYEGKGVPPAMLDLAEPVLKTGQKAVIDLSDSEQADASKVIRDLLKAAENTVDLSKEKGSSEDADERTEAQDLASDEKWGTH